MSRKKIPRTPRKSKSMSFQISQDFQSSPLRSGTLLHPLVLDPWAGLKVPSQIATTIIPNKSLLPHSIEPTKIKEQVPPKSDGMSTKMS